MPDPKPNVNALAEQWLAQAKAWGALAMQRLFGLAEGWEKRRDIVRNNLELGMGHLQAGRFRDAIFRFTLVTWFDPKNAEGWYGLGCAYAGAGKPQQARQALGKALQLKPEYEEAKAVLAEMDKPLGTPS